MAGIALAAVAAYANTFGNALVFPHVADIADNPTIRHLGRLGQVLRPPTAGGLTVGGRPVLNLSLAINYALGGTAVWGYHAGNLLIHIAAALTLFGLVRRTVRGTQATLVAFGVAFLWALHPLQTEAVTYIVERAESLMGLFYLFTLYAFVRWAQPGESSPPAKIWPVLAVTSCFLGMGTKEVMVSAPVIVFLYDRTFLSGSFRTAWQTHRRLYAALASSWLVVGALALSTAKRGGTAGFGTGVPWSAYAQTQFEAVTHYLRLAFWPRPLIFDYGAQWVRSPGEVLPSAFLVAALLALTLVGLRRRPVLGFLGVSFFAILAPTSLVPVVVQTMAERRMYLALIPLIIVAVAVLRGALARQGASRLALPIFLALGLALGVATAARNRDYRDNVTLWGLTAAQRPDSPRAHYYFGIGLDEAGRPAAAAAEFRTALRLDPTYAEAHNRLGIEEVGAGRVPEAIAQYQEAIRDEPDFPDAHYNLGTAWAQSGRLPEAIAELREALALKPAFPDAEMNLGLALAQSDQIAEAISHYEAALRLKPDYAAAETNLGSALAVGGKLPEAIAHLQRAIRLQPDSAVARHLLARIYAATGRPPP
jgi:tetratricopeptide (TPR) repeat protein